MLLFMTRHGETQWNKLKKTQGTQDISLTDLGRYQAESLARRLEKETTINTIYSSDLKRAKETSAIIGARLGIEPIPCKEIREVCFGHWQGLSIEEIEKIYPGELARWREELSFAPNNGESLSSVHNRIKIFMKALERNHPDPTENILIVSHAATIKVFILELLGIPLHILTKIKISQTGLSLLRMAKGNNSMLYMNDTCHIK